MTRFATYFATFAAIATIAGFGAEMATTGAAGAASATSALHYTALPVPVRIADTRTGATDPSTYASDTLSAGGSLTVDIPSTIGMPEGTGAVVVNITATDPTSSGFLSVSPGATVATTTSSVDFTKGQTVANLVTVALGTDPPTGLEAFTVYDGPTAATGGGSVDFVADVEGYYGTFVAEGVTGGSERESDQMMMPGEYHPVTPSRIYDSRTGSGYPGAGSTLGPGGVDNVRVADMGGVPATATAVVLDVAVTDTTASSYLEVYPRQPTTAAPAGATSVQNWVPGETIAAQAIVGLGRTGTGFIATGIGTGIVSFENYAGSADIVVDVEGYFKMGTTGSLFTPLATPERILDTRPGTVTGGASTAATVTGAGATGAALDVTDLYQGTARGNFLTVYPEGKTVPWASSVNYTLTDTYDVVANSVYGTTGTGGAVGIYNGPPYAGPAAVVVDEYGYFAPAASGVFLTATKSTVAPRGTVTITGTVTYEGVAQTTDALSVTTTGGTACGTPSGEPKTGLTGAFTLTYMANTTTGSCTITVKEANHGMTGSVTIATAATPNDTITLTPATFTAVTANAVGSATKTQAITITVTGPGEYTNTIDLTKTAMPTGGVCGSLPSSVTTATKTTTTGNKVAVVYTAPTKSGFCTITATEAKAPTGATAKATKSLVIDNKTPAGTAATVTVATFSTKTGLTAKSTVTANGTTKLYVIATVETATPAAVAGDQVLFSVTSTTPTNTPCGTITPMSVKTNTKGVVEAVYTASRFTAHCTITAAEAGTALSGTTTPPVTQSAASNVLTLTANPVDLTAGSKTTSKLTVTETTSTGVLVSGHIIVFTTTGTCGAFTPTFPTGEMSGGTLSVKIGAAAVTEAGTFCRVVAHDLTDTLAATVVIDNVIT